MHANALVANDYTLADEAVAAYEGCQEPILRAGAVEDAGRLRPEDQRDDAVARLDAALDLYTGVGAIRDVARVRSLLRQRGVRRSGWSRPGRPTARWASNSFCPRIRSTPTCDGSSRNSASARGWNWRT
jgi:hypothetical protein